MPNVDAGPVHGEPPPTCVAVAVGLPGLQRAEALLSDTHAGQKEAEDEPLS